MLGRTVGGGAQRRSRPLTDHEYEHLYEYKVPADHEYKHLQYQEAAVSSASGHVSIATVSLTPNHSMGEPNA